MYGLLSLHPWGYHSPVGGVCAKRAASLARHFFALLNVLYTLRTTPCFQSSHLQTFDGLICMQFPEVTAGCLDYCVSSVGGTIRSSVTFKHLQDTTSDASIQAYHLAICRRASGP